MFLFQKEKKLHPKDLTLSSVSSYKGKIFIKLGLYLIFFSFLLWVLFFFPIILHEVKYLFRDRSEKKVILQKALLNGSTKELADKNSIIPVDEAFGIVIPKINANAPVIPNVDPFDPQIYQKALTKGVAHAEGTVFPGQIGNSFIFSHSSTNFLEAQKYNSVFYLISKLQKGDDFYMLYNGTKYRYVVEKVKVVNASDIEFITNPLIYQSFENNLEEMQEPSFLDQIIPRAEKLDKDPNGKSFVTLMTCWPAGTDLKRLIVVGKLENKL